MASASRRVEQFVDKTYKKGFMKKLFKLCQEEEYTDLILQSGCVEIHCHRIVLMVASDYFKAMFRFRLRETTPDTVQLPLEPELLASIVEYVYTGEIEFTIDNVENLVMACDILLLDGLKSGCEDFLLAQVDVTNCVAFYRFAELYRLQRVKRKAMRLMMAEFKAVAFTDQFKELSSDVLVELLKDDDVNVDNEDIVVECVLNWVQHDPENRKTSLETVLEHVRLPHCTSDYLRHMANMCDMLTDRCDEYLLEAMSFQADTAHQGTINNCRTVPRKSFRKCRLLVVGGRTSPWIDGQRRLNEDMQYYSESDGCWMLLTDLPQSVYFKYSVCYVNRSVVVTGGSDGAGKDAVDACWLYDIDAEVWGPIPRLTTARKYHGSVAVGDCVYVLGGRGVGRKNVLTSVECLNLKTRHWSSMADMPVALIRPVVAAYDKSIFVFGGQDAHRNRLRSVCVYDTTRDEWSTRSDMIVLCDFGAAVALKDSIYVLGGHNRVCLRYDPAMDTWTSLSRPRAPHKHAPVAVYRGCILVAGGGDRHRVSSIIEQYDPITDTWSDWKYMGVQLANHAMFNVDLSGV